MKIVDRIKQTFIDETEDLLSELENLLLDLEKNSEDKESLNAVFRVMHTIKGSAGMVGEDKVYKFAHIVEDVFDSLRNGSISFNSYIADLALESRDIILSLINNLDPDIDRKIRIIEEKLEDSSCLAEEKLEGYSEPSEENVISGKENNPPIEIYSGKSADKTFFIRFYPDEDILKRGSNPFLIIQELKKFGTITIDVDDAMLPTFDEINNEKCYLGWNIYLTTKKSYIEVKDVFLFVESDSEIIIEEAANELLSEDGDVAKLGEILVDRGFATPDAVNEVLDNKKKIGEELIDKNIVSKEDVESALLEQEHLKRIQQKQVGKQNIKISTEKLDDFVNLIGELVTLQAQLNQHSLNVENYELESITESLQILTEELRDSVLGIRMIPVGQTFGIFRRLVRDLSAELDKKINLITIGEETELDKAVLDKLKEPLVHLIRNCIDHGIEKPEIRRDVGKEESGTITLSAIHSGGHVNISIVDDGKGINRESIRKKAVEKGLVDSNEKLTDEKIYDLVFQNGFSTAESVSKVSGRGVGMDVVRKEIEKMQGNVAISSEEGKYTKIVISIPLTLAIIDGLLIQVGKDYYILPLGSVEACMDRKDAEEKKEGNKNIIHYREHFLPYLCLRNLLDYESEPPEREHIVVINTDRSKYGIIVDEVIGDYQTVIKNLGKIFNNTKTFSGATIMGDGQIALILNVNNLAKVI